MDCRAPGRSCEKDKTPLHLRPAWRFICIEWGWSGGRCGSWLQQERRRRHRERQNLSQLYAAEHLAEQLGIAQQQITRALTEDETRSWAFYQRATTDPKQRASDKCHKPVLVEARAPRSRLAATQQISLTLTKLELGRRIEHYPQR